MKRPAACLLTSLLCAFAATRGSQASAQLAPREPDATAAAKPATAAAAKPAARKVGKPAKPAAAAPPPYVEEKALPGGTIEKIVIKGNKKIEADAIKAKLVSKEKEEYSEDKIRQDLSELFALGYFYNIEVDRTEGGGAITVTYTVTEKPSITEIQYNGNEDLEDDELKRRRA